MGSLYRPTLKSGKAGRIWWAKYYVDGRPVRESTQTDDKHAAKRFLKTREGAAAVGAPVPPRLDRVLYDELAADLRQHYETTGRRRLREAELRLRHLDRFLQGRRAATIGPAAIMAYVAARQAEPVMLGTRGRDGRVIRWTRTQADGAPTYPSNRTINLELSVLKRMLRLAYEHGKLLRVPPIRLLREAPPREGFFEEAQYEAVRRRLPADLQVAVTIAYTYGWRVRSEVLTLQRRQVDLKVGTLRLEPGTTKNREGRLVYLTSELRSRLAEQLERVDQVSRRLGRIIPWVFPRLRGRRAGEPRRAFVKAWETACRRAGVPGRLLHDFRRTAVRNLERAGVPRSVAMKMTGHQTEAVYRRYAIVSDADLREATQRLTGPGTFSGTSATGTLTPVV